MDNDIVNTIEDCLENVPNRFALVLLAADRAKDLIKKTLKIKGFI